MDGQVGNDDAAIAEFHAAARRHKAKVYGVVGVLLILIGIAVVVVTLAAGGDAAAPGMRYEIRVLAVGVGFVIAGLGGLINAWRIGTGRANDVDYNVR